jgi:hypothetical protein
MSATAAEPQAAEEQLAAEAAAKAGVAEAVEEGGFRT